jgi:hypothetical protein
MKRSINSRVRQHEGHPGPFGTLQTAPRPYVEKITLPAPGPVVIDDGCSRYVVDAVGKLSLATGFYDNRRPGKKSTSPLAANVNIKPRIRTSVAPKMLVFFRFQQDCSGVLSSNRHSATHNPGLGVFWRSCRKIAELIQQVLQCLAHWPNRNVANCEYALPTGRGSWCFRHKGFVPSIWRMG